MTIKRKRNTKDGVTYGTFWKYDEDRNPRCIRFKVYLTIFLSYLIPGIFGRVLACMIDKKDINVCTIAQSILTQCKYGVIIIAILYVVMTVAGYSIGATGDLLQRHVYNHFRRRAICKSSSKYIKFIRRKESYPETSFTTKAAFPACMVVCERIEVSNGVYRRSPMVVNALSAIEKNVLYFSPRHVYSMFDERYIFNGSEISTVVSKINSLKQTADEKKILRNCDGLAVIEFDVVFDTTILNENNHADNLLRLKIRSVPCTVTGDGKILPNIDV